VDRDDPDTIYHEILFGGLNRTNLKGPKGDATKKIRPPVVAEKGQPAGPNRFNWNAPFILSPHDTKVLYFGSQYVWRSSNRGDTWTKMSPDLSRVKGGAVNSRTVLTLAESPVKGLVLWAGTDDGNIWVSNQTRGKWAEVGQNLEDVPNERAVSKIECDHKDVGTAYVAIDRHRNDDTKPYIFKTTDLGETWEPIVKGLPAGAVVGVVRQSSKNPKLLFAGTELGLYTSPDGGKTWHHLNRTGLPPGVRVDDLVIHPRERELVIGTHGRGVWVMDIAPLEQLTEEVLSAPAHLFEVKPSVQVKQVPRPAPAKGAEPVGKAFVAPNPPAGVPVSFYLGKGAAKAEVVLTDKDGKTVASKAFDSVSIGLYTAALPAPPGEYTVTLKAGPATKSGKALVTKEGEMPADDQ